MAAMLFAYAVFFSFAYRDLTAATGALLLFGAVQLTMMGCGLWPGERLAAVRLAGSLIALGGPGRLLLPGLAAPPPLARRPDAGRGRGLGRLFAARQGRRRSDGGDRRQLPAHRCPSPPLLIWPRSAMEQLIRWACFTPCCPAP